MDSELKTLRACVICGLVRPLAEWMGETLSLAPGSENNGGDCPNCVNIIGSLGGDEDKIKEVSSSNFSGYYIIFFSFLIHSLITMMKPGGPGGSWVSRWIGLQKRLSQKSLAIPVIGMYAMSVHSNIPAHLQRLCDQENITTAVLQ